MEISEDDQYTRQIARGRNRLAFLAIVAAVLAVFLWKEWAERRDLDQRVTNAVNDVEAHGGGIANLKPPMIDPATPAFGGLALGATGLALVCVLARWLASWKPKIAFELSAVTGLALLLAAMYGFSLVPEGRPASGRGQVTPRAFVMGSLPALFGGFFLVSFSLSSLRAAKALLRERGGAARGATGIG